MPKFKITWADLEALLKKSNKLSPGEEIDIVTLVKPKEILIHTRERR